MDTAALGFTIVAFATFISGMIICEGVVSAISLLDDMWEE